MVLTESMMLELNTTAPDFTLPDTVSGKNLSLQDVKSNIATVIMFICNHCPYVKHIENKLAEIAQAYQAKGIQFVAISANDVNEYPSDAPDEMKANAKRLGYCFPYLYDESQEVAKAYKAACTPDFFIFDKNLACVYRGRFDESSPGKKDVAVTGKDLATALDTLLAGQPISSDQKPSIGCNIKWKSTSKA